MLEYKIKRKIRRLLPNFFSHFLMEKGQLLKPSEGWYEYISLVDEFLENVEMDNDNFHNKTVLDLGFGGVFGLSCELLERGFKKVIALDPYAPIRKKGNKLVFKRYPQYFTDMKPKPQHIEVVRKTLEEYVLDNEETIDFLVSNSVLEHIQNVESLIKSSSRILKRGGVSVHKIDLRDHFFRYPFHMLNFSRQQWEKLNPPSNLNRLRYEHYNLIFTKHFVSNKFLIDERLPEKYKINENRLHPDFITDSVNKDVTRITVISRKV